MWHVYYTCKYRFLLLLLGLFRSSLFATNWNDFKVYELINSINTCNKYIIRATDFDCTQNCLRRKMIISEEEKIQIIFIELITDPSLYRTTTCSSKVQLLLKCNTEKGINLVHHTYAPCHLSGIYSDKWNKVLKYLQRDNRFSSLSNTTPYLTLYS